MYEPLKFDDNSEREEIFQRKFLSENGKNNNLRLHIEEARSDRENKHTRSQYLQLVHSWRRTSCHHWCNTFALPRLQCSTRNVNSIQCILECQPLPPPSALDFFVQSSSHGPYCSNVSEHVVLDTPFHAHWLSILKF